MKKLIAVVTITLFVTQVCSVAVSQNRTQAVPATNSTTVKMGKQEWMKKNLDVDHYSNGDIIPQVQDPKLWSKLTTGAWCYYENKDENGVKYGKLYNWYAVTDPRGLAPKGYHIPTVDEFSTLISYLNNKSIPISYLQSTQYWKTNTGINKTGFTALPGGERTEKGDFMFSALTAYWWTSSEDANTYPKGVEKGSYYFYIEDEGSYFQQNAINKKYGFSVRCIKD